MAQRMLTFDDIVDGISEALGIQTSDLIARNKIKRLVNMIYIDEVVPFKRWSWLQKTTSVVHNEYYYAGTASVTPDSTTVTLSAAPNASEGSFKGHKFSVASSNKVYTVSAHTAGSATVTLTTAYQETLNATATYKIWRDRIDLPVGAKETVQIWHAEQPRPVKGIGPQEFRKLEAADPKAEGFPTHYNTHDYFDPSDSDAEFETDRYRQVRLYPSITQTPVTIHVDYIEEVTELDDDADEPVMPVSDRIVLYYGAGAEAWSILGRNEEMAAQWRAKFQQKLARMAGERDDGFDTPSLAPKSGYVNLIRRGGLRRREVGIASNAGQSSVSLPSYLKSVEIDGGNLRDDLTADAGVLIDGRDVSADGALLDTLTDQTEVSLTDNTANQVVATFALATYDVVHMDYSVKRGSDVEAGRITLAGAGSTASIAQGAIAATASIGVTLSADIVGGNLRLLATTSSTGSAATLKYRAFTWLSG